MRKTFENWKLQETRRGKDLNEDYEVCIRRGGVLPIDERVMLLKGVMAARKKKECITIAVTVIEKVDEEGNHIVLYPFSFFNAEGDEVMDIVIRPKKEGVCPSFGMCLGWVLDIAIKEAGFRVKICDTSNGQKKEKDTNTRVTVLCFGLAKTLGSFSAKGKNDFLEKLKKNLVNDTIWNAITMTISSRQHWKKYKLSVEFRDIKKFLGEKRDMLSAFDTFYGAEKFFNINVEGGNGCFDEITRKSHAILHFMSEWWGKNRCIPLTAMTASAESTYECLREYYGCDKDELSRIYNGTRMGRKSVSENEGGGRKYRKKREPIHDNASQLIEIAKECYRGGISMCTYLGYFEGKRFIDVDLKSAYLMVMSCIPDVDFDTIRIDNSTSKLTRSDFETPFDILYAYVTFRFPDTVKYPCIPIRVEESIVCPRTSNGREGVWACGFELYVALLLGAEIEVKRKVTAKSLKRADGSTSCVLKEVAKQKVKDRKIAEKIWGKDNWRTKITKLLGNGAYGKIAQGVGKDEKNEPCKITSEHHAASITSLVRGLMSLALNEIDKKGYRVYSTMTDGFITDAPEEVVYNLELGGMRDIFEREWHDICGNDDGPIWAVKHEMSEWYNLKDTANVSCEHKGVCAHGKLKTSFVPGTLEDKHSYMKLVVSRTGRIRSTEVRATSLKSYLTEMPHQYSEDKRVREVSFEFDMKRKPLRKGMIEKSVHIDGETYLVANVETEAYNDILEYRKYRDASKNMCLRTLEDWNRFFLKLESEEKREQVKDVSEWKILMSVVQGARIEKKYKEGKYWVIPALNEGTTQECIARINQLNRSERRFTIDDWKNAGRKEREDSILPRGFLEEKLQEFLKLPKKSEEDEDLMR